MDLVPTQRMPSFARWCEHLSGSPYLARRPLRVSDWITRRAARIAGRSGRGRVAVRSEMERRLARYAERTGRVLEGRSGEEEQCARSSSDRS